MLAKIYVLLFNMSADSGVRCVSSSALPLCSDGGVSVINNPIVINPPSSFNGKSLTAIGNVDITGVIDPTAITFDEQPSNPSVVSSGKGTLWVRNDSPNVPIFTDDAGTDHDMLDQDGPQGVQGSIGAQGPQGVGPQGAQGSGAQGNQGIQGPQGDGDVNGPGSSIDQIIPRFFGVTGKQIVGSLLAIDVFGDILRDGVVFIQQKGGVSNFAAGTSALESVTTGSSTTAIGRDSLKFNTTGSSNTSVGSAAMFSNIDGSFNTAVGDTSMLNNTSGNNNTAVGKASLEGNIGGSSNTAAGFQALHRNVGGINNTAFGANSLDFISSGGNNIGVGNGAGSSLTGADTGNIMVGNIGTMGDNNTTKIGTSQTTCFVAGISGATVPGGVTTLVGPTGQLGTILSSRRYKQDIETLESSDILLQMNPVRFRYKENLSMGYQIGLIAEEVETIYPNLVTYKEGKIETVRYHQLHGLYIKAIQDLTKRVEKLEKKN